MKTENLGTIHELPPIPKDDSLRLLIVEGSKEHNQFYSAIKDNNLVWYGKFTSKGEYTNEDFKTGFPTVRKLY